MSGLPLDGGSPPGETRSQKRTAEDAEMSDSEEQEVSRARARLNMALCALHGVETADFTTEEDELINPAHEEW